MTRLFLKAGYVPLLAWLLLVTLAGVLAENYSPIASHASVMTLQDGPAHIITNMAAWVSGLAIIVFGLGIWRLSGRVFSAGAVCWIVFGLSMLANGTWPMGSPLHGFYIIGIFNILAPALSCLDIRNDQLRKRLYGVTMFVSLSSVLYLWVLLNGFDPEGYSGLTQRVFGTVNFLWPLFFAWVFFRQPLVSD